MSDKKVVFATVEQAHEDIVGKAGELEARLSQLQQDLAPIAKDTANWDSDSHEAYQTYQQQWDESADELFTVLAKIGDGVGVANVNAMEAESANTDNWTV